MVASFESYSASVTAGVLCLECYSKIMERLIAALSLASLSMFSCGSSAAPCRADWHVGDTVNYTVVRPLGPNDQCADELGLEDGAMIMATIRQFAGGETCLTAAADVTTSKSTWTMSGHLEGMVGADLGANYSVTTASNCQFDGPIYITGHDAPRLVVALDQTRDPDCPYTCHGEWYLSESN